ncbi:MAG TPA: tail fiber domain-containing protein [Pyrinomonadaceae bacterium]|nr:tail fiber domain-containing protein [Pyrinomonadaceae bacterium]
MKHFVAALLLILALLAVSHAQTTAFNYQGSLNNSGTPANGNFDFEFALFDTLGGANQIGSTLTRSGVVVTNGVFSVTLDFGNQFPASNRFLEIRVRTTGAGAFTPLAPRQPVNSAPYAIKSVAAENAVIALNATNANNATTATTATNATQLGGIAASQYVVSGAPVINAGTQLNLGGQRILFAAAGNTFVGFGTGPTTTGNFNSFFGKDAGAVNVTGGDNAFFGEAAGKSNINGFGNSFFGQQSGFFNTSGGNNAFFGVTTGSGNKQGNFNSFFGGAAGNTNVDGDLNTAIGHRADVTTSNLRNATAIGANSAVSQSNSLVLGSINGVNLADADTNVGIGTTAPSARFHVVGSSSAGTTPIAIVESSGVQIPLAFKNLGIEVARIRANNLGNLFISTVGGSEKNIFFRAGDDSGTDMYIDGATGNVGIGTTSPTDKLDVTGSMRVSVLGTGGVTSLCRNATNQISTCSSSARYKSNITTFSSGLDLIRKLRPVSFRWRESGKPDLGLVAEDVAAVEPLLTIANDKGQVEGVKYDRVGVVLVNAVQEQQAEIDLLRKTNAEQDARIRKQQDEIDALKQLVCTTHSAAEICRRRKHRAGS